MPEFYAIIARKIFSRFLGGLGGGGTCPPAPRLLRLCYIKATVYMTM